MHTKEAAGGRFAGAHWDKQDSQADIRNPLRYLLITE